MNLLNDEFIIMNLLNTAKHLFSRATWVLSGRRMNLTFEHFVMLVLLHLNSSLYRTTLQNENRFDNFDNTVFEMNDDLTYM
jgi:hypothetical protein